MTTSRSISTNVGCWYEAMKIDIRDRLSSEISRGAGGDLTLLRDALAEIDRLSADERRIDWLADKEQWLGSVELPIECVLQHLDDMRAAIDAAMALHAELVDAHDEYAFSQL